MGDPTLADAILDRVEFNLTLPLLLVLAHAHQHPQLAGNVGNLALLVRAGELGLIAQDAALQVCDAYRELRGQQHRLKMQGMDKARIAPGKLSAHIKVVTDLWRVVLG